MNDIQSVQIYIKLQRSQDSDLFAKFGNDNRRIYQNDTGKVKGK